MQAELLESVAIIRKCIDECRPDEANDYPPKSPQNESDLEFFTPLSLKERVTRNAVERGVVRGERSQDQKKISRLEYDVDRLLGEVEKWKREASAAAKALQEAKAEARQNSAAAELWRENAEESSRQKSAVEEQYKCHKDRDAAAKDERIAAVREVEEQLAREKGRWEQERRDLQDRLTVVHDQLRATEEMVQKCQAKERNVGRQLDENQRQLEVLKTELQKRTRSFDMQIDKLEQELKELGVRSLQTASREELNSALSTAQSYLRNMSKMQEESSALQLVAQQLRGQLQVLVRGDEDIVGENDEGSTLLSADATSSYEYFGGVAELLSHLDQGLDSVRTRCLAAARDQKQTHKLTKDLQELEDALREVGVGER